MLGPQTQLEHLQRHQNEQEDVLEEDEMIREPYVN